MNMYGGVIVRIKLEAKSKYCQQRRHSILFLAKIRIISELTNKEYVKFKNNSYKKWK